MFDNLGSWVWVGFAWAELIIAYIAYLLYLNWREQRAKLKDES